MSNHIAQPPEVSKPVYDVAIALVRRAGRWLVARRHDHVHLGGLWEFPGGKREHAETHAEAAVRELLEECAVTAEAEQVLDPYLADYGDRLVQLTPVVCRWRAGEPQPIDNQECRWVTDDELHALDMPHANHFIVGELDDFLDATRTSSPT